jgi:hypothetical protein
VTAGQVTFTDAGSSQTVNVGSDGTAAATFTFNVFQAPAKPHAIDANFDGATGLGSSSASTQTPDKSADYFFTLFFDYALLLSLFSHG